MSTGGSFELIFEGGKANKRVFIELNIIGFTMKIVDDQVIVLRKLVKEEKMTVKKASSIAGMSETSAHRYLRTDLLPSEIQASRGPRTYLTRPDAFASVAAECIAYLNTQGASGTFLFKRAV